MTGHRDADNESAAVILLASASFGVEVGRALRGSSGRRISNPSFNSLRDVEVRSFFKSRPCVT